MDSEESTKNEGPRPSFPSVSPSTPHAAPIPIPPRGNGPAASLCPAQMLQQPMPQPDTQTNQTAVEELQRLRDQIQRQRRDHPPEDWLLEARIEHYMRRLAQLRDRPESERFAILRQEERRFRQCAEAMAARDREIGRQVQALVLQQTAAERLSAAAEGRRRRRQEEAEHGESDHVAEHFAASMDLDDQE